MSGNWINHYSTWRVADLKADVATVGGARTALRTAVAARVAWLLAIRDAATTARQSGKPGAAGTVDQPGVILVR